MQPVFRDPVERPDVQGERAHRAVPDDLLQERRLHADRKLIRDAAAVAEAERKIGDAVAFPRPQRLVDGADVDLPGAQRGDAPVEVAEFPEHQADGGEVTTIEGLATNGTLHPVQAAFVDKGGVQCGFCTPGMVMAAASLLERNPSPTLEDVREGLAGNLCRCTGYAKIYESVLAAAESRRTPSNGQAG